MKKLLTLLLGVAALSLGACAHQSHGGKSCPLGFGKKNADKKADACCSGSSHSHHGAKTRCCTR